MPKATFDKIAPEKKERVLIAAARLFAELGYSQTDMSQLAERCGVAKGSLYNYFESKEDLFAFLCADGLERSRAAVYGGIPKGADIYVQVEHIFRQGLAFGQAHPEYVALYLGAAAAGTNRLDHEVSLQVEKFTADHLKGLIKSGIKAGIVRADLDVNLTAFLINSIYIMFLASLVSRHFKVRIAEYLEIKGEISASSIEEHVDRTLEMIKGILRVPDAV